VETLHNKSLKPEPNCIAAASTGPLAVQQQQQQHKSFIQQSLGHWEQNQYDFHWCEDPIPCALVLHRQHQQDALRFSWPGNCLVAGTDVGVHWKQERMAAGYVAGTDLIPLMTMSAPVGGPLASLRAE
jgi:hypothetical protein